MWKNVCRKIFDGKHCKIKNSVIYMYSLILDGNREGRTLYFLLSYNNKPSTELVG